MIQRNPKSSSRTSWTILLGLLCLVLVVLGTTVQAAHSHPGGDISHADCSLCATAHVATQVISNPVPIPALIVIADRLEIAPRIGHVAEPHFALFTRPPPFTSNAA